jgi:hypothetical protein
LTLFAFGAAPGSLDVAMNIHGVEVERAARTPLMSGFHALFSVGGFAGATVMTFLLSSRIIPLASTLFASVLMVIAMALAAPRLLRASHSEKTPLIVAPHRVVLLLAALAFVMFLVEGAILDWSALLATGRGLVSEARGGLGYSMFAIAMTVGRFRGDFVTARVGDRAVLFWGGLATMAGFALVLSAPIASRAMSGFLLIGLGASNIVPVLFRGAGAQRAMPAGLAVAAITTAGYAGVLVGPAAIGLVAKSVRLPVAFWLLAASARSSGAPELPQLCAPELADAGLRMWRCVRMTSTGRMKSNAERSMLRSASRTAAGGVSVSAATIRPSRPCWPLYARYPVRSCSPPNGHNPPSLCQAIPNLSPSFRTASAPIEASKAAVYDVRNASTRDVLKYTNSGHSPAARSWLRGSRTVIRIRLGLASRCPWLRPGFGMKSAADPVDQAD